MSLALAQPPTRRRPERCEADTVLASVGGTEGELAGMGALGVDDAVVVVEDFVDGYGDGEVWVGGKDVVLVLECAIVACDMLGQK